MNNTPVHDFRVRFLRNGLGVFVLKLMGAGLSLLITILLARALGPAGYGVYVLVFAVVAIVLIPVESGVPQVVVRETSRADVYGDKERMRAVWDWATAFVSKFSIALLAIGVSVLIVAKPFIDTAYFIPVFLGFLLMPLVALTSVRCAALRGLRYVVFSQLPGSIVQPGFLLLLVVVQPLIWPEIFLKPVHAVAFSCVATIASFLFATALFKHFCSSAIANSENSEPDVLKLGRVTIPFTLVAGLILINGQADLIMLGLLRSTEEVGIYKVAIALSTIVVFGLQAINQAVQPDFARLYKEKKIQQLQKLVTYSARLIFLSALVPFLIILTCGTWAVSALFGNEYTLGMSALFILAFGQLVNATMGSVGLLLNMTGHEKDTLKGVAVSTVCNIVMNAILIPQFGINGAAVATLVTLLIWNILLRHYVRARLGIESTAFARAAD